MEYISAVAENVHLAMRSLHRAATAAHKAGDVRLWLDLLDTIHDVAQYQNAQSEALLDKHAAERSK